MIIFIKIIMPFIIFFNLLFIPFSHANALSAKTIAVLDFENNTGQRSLDHLKKGLSDSLTNNLARYQGISIVERSRLKEAITELSLSQSGLVSSNAAVRLGRFIGSQYVILGSLVKTGEMFEVGIRMVDVESGRVVLGKSVRCSGEEAIFKSIDYLSLETANGLGERVDKVTLDNSRRDAENFVAKKNDLSWLFWVGGGVLVLGATATVLALTLGAPKQNNNTNVCVGDCPEPPTTVSGFNLKFGFGI